MTSRYIELHCRSAFSFLDGVSLPENLATIATAYDMPSIALLDRNGVYGAPRIHMGAAKMGIKAHVGAELRIAENPTGDSPYLPVLVESRTGYQNLCRLITRTKLRVAKSAPSAATIPELQEHAQGLICLTGDENGPLAQALKRGGVPQARKQLEQLILCFGKQNVFVELQRHFLREEEQRNQAALSLAREFQLPIIATNGVCYAEKKERLVADVFACIQHKRTLATAGRLLHRNSERYLRTAAEMGEIFADLPAALANTVEVAGRLDFTLENLGYEFPSYPVPVDETMASLLRRKTYVGATKRYKSITPRIRQQLEHELAFIERLGFAGYFLIVWDIVDFCRRHKIMAQGRGSAANSAVCYSLGITAVDPIQMDLLFERFLSEERGRTEWPDIDIDLPSGDKREQVIQYVYERYGRRGAAMTANVITYRARSASREIGRVLGFDEETLSRISALVGSWEWKGPDDTLEKHFKNAGFDLQVPQIAHFLNLTQSVQDLPRHLGQHSGGMVICQGNLDSVVPLERASMDGRVVLQWDKDDCADLNLVKVDLLGLGMMAALEDCVSLISKHYKQEVDLGTLPQESKVYDVIARADTIGMFQLESRAQQASLPRNRPNCFYDLVVQVALIRPGPIVGQMTSPYLERRLGRQAVTYPWPPLEPVLKRTLGIPLFQEQLLRMAMICANFSGGEAEELRRALGSKRSRQRMLEIEKKLRAGMLANGIKPAAQDEIVKFITSFALYGFPESHAASFALLAYASAYFKVYYPEIFLIALLNNYPMGFYSPAILVRDAQRHGVRVRPIDILRSNHLCTLEHNGEQVSVRLGLNYARKLRSESAEAIVERRGMRAFSTIDELKRRVPELHEDELGVLAEIGALNGLNGGTNRRGALWQVAWSERFAGPLIRNIQEEGEGSPLEPMTIEERMIADYEGTGLTTGHHPISYRRADLNAMKVKRAIDLCNESNGKWVRIAGDVVVRQRPGTAKGLIFLSLEDETGISNAVVMPDVYRKYRLQLVSESYLVIEGELQNIDGVISVKAERIFPLEISRASSASHDFQQRKC